jgi:hypothetical protein
MFYHVNIFFWSGFFFIRAGLTQSKKNPVGQAFLSRKKNPVGQTFLSRKKNPVGQTFLSDPPDFYGRTGIHACS